MTRPRLGALRQLSGVLTGGLVAVAVALAVAAVVAAYTGSPGPGPAALAWHGAGALLAVVGQVYADRALGRRGALVACGVIAVTAAVLAEQWLL